MQQPPPLQKGGGGKENLFFSRFRLNLCVCVCGYSMTLKTDEKIINFLYLLTFIEKIISCNGCSICGMSNSKNGLSLVFFEK